MAQQDDIRGRSGGVEAVDYTASLDGVPELWTDILRRVSEADRQFIVCLHDK